MYILYKIIDIRKMNTIYIGITVYYGFDYYNALETRKKTHYKES